MFRKNINLKFTITIIAAFFYLHPFAQNWNVPADKKAKNSNVKFDDATTKEGEAIYTKLSKKKSLNNLPEFYQY